MAGQASGPTRWREESKAFRKAENVGREFQRFSTGLGAELCGTSRSNFRKVSSEFCKTILKSTSIYDLKHFCNSSRIPLNEWNPIVLHICMQYHGNPKDEFCER